VYILCWNCRGFNKPKKRTLLKKNIKENQIDILGLQETKMENFTDRILNNLASNITKWIVKKSIGNSGGILVGINISLFSILDVWELDFTITVLLKKN
jgi:exonuclease III